MKRLQFLLVIIFASFFTSISFAQTNTCGPNTQTGNFCNSVNLIGNDYRGIFAPTNGSNWFTIGNYGPGQWFRMWTLPGGCYSVSTCGEPIPTDITVHQGGSITGGVIAYNNQDGPICNGAQASVTFNSVISRNTIDVRQVNCSNTGSASINVRIRQNNNLNFTSSNAAMCEGESRTITATPGLISGSFDPLFGTVAFTGPGVNGSVFTAPTPVGDSQVFAITYTFGYVSEFQNITVYRTPSTANAGFDQSLACTQTSTTLAGNVPSYGVGHWSIASGPGEFVDSLDPNTDIINLIPGDTTIVQWNITNGPCNASTSQLTIYYNDTQAPVPPTLGPDTIGCAGFVNPPIATDNCLGTIAGTTSAVANYVEGDSLFVTWDFEDNNGNTAQASQWIYYYDIIAPDPISLSDMTVTCSDTLPVYTTTDACSGTITGTTNNALNFVDGDSTLITWDFDDGNGNVTSIGQWYYYDDTTSPPAPSALPLDTVRCDLALNPPKVLDNCADTVTGVSTDTLNFVIGNTQTITWIFDDGNGNTSSVNQNLLFIDDEGPVIGSLPFVTVDCNGTLTAPIAVDGCAGNVTGTTNDVLNFVEGGSTIINWSFDDGNGNITTASQTYVYDDVTPPIPTTLANVTVDCNGTLSNAPTGTDNCAGTITATTNDVLNFVEGDSTVVTWTFDDGNGNSSTSTQTYYYDDVTPPTTPTLASVTADCNDTLIAPTTNDDCAGTVAGTTSDVLNFVEGGSQTVTWTFDDGNGNISTSTQTVNFDDDTPPVSPVLNDVIIDCAGTLTNPTTTDDCAGTITGTTTNTLTYVEGDSTLITWTFDDGNGNSSTSSQWYFYLDTVGPNSPVLANVTVDCNGTLTSPTAMDNCSGMVNGTTSNTLNFVEGDSTLITWTFTDANGNTSTAGQWYVYDDITAPSAPTLNNVTVDCNGTLTTPSALDDCAGVITGTTNDVLNFVDGGSTVITWSFDDGNGNVSTTTQTYFYDDITDPVPDQPNLADISALCKVISLTAPTATDNCAANVNVSSDAVLPITSVGTTVVTWTYDDGNGNTTTQSQNVIISGYAVTASIQSGTTIQSDQTGDTYQWIDCSNNQAIAGETSQTFTATANGDYAVIVTDQNCVDTSNCVNITGVNLSRTVNSIDILIYPNPAEDGRFTVTSSKEIIEIEIYDLLGRNLSNQIISSEGNLIDASSLKSAEYILKVYFKEGVETRKIQIK